MMCAVLLALVAACGAPRSGGFSEIERGKIPPALSATTTTTTTTTTTIPETTTTFEPVAETTTTVYVAPTTTIPSELIRLYFVAGRDGGIVSIDAPLAGRDPSVAQVMTALESAPTGASAQGLRTAIPPDEHPNARNDGRGLVTVDLSSSFKEAAGEDQRYAIAQMVLTFTHLGGFSQVTFTMDGQPTQVQLADGSLSELGAILYSDNYDDLLSTSANPPTTATTTTTTTTTSPATAGTDPGVTVEEPTTLPTG